MPFSLRENRESPQGFLWPSFGRRRASGGIIPRMRTTKKRSVLHVLGRFDQGPRGRYDNRVCRYRIGSRDGNPGSGSRCSTPSCNDGASRDWERGKEASG